MMNAPVERIDRPADVAPGEIINKVDRSSKEKEDAKNGFSKKLKEKMEEEQTKKKKKREDIAELSEINNDEENKDQQRVAQQHGAQQEAEASDNAEDDSTDGDDESNKHVDLRA